MTLGPAVREGEYVFGVAHIFASFNDTFIVSFGDLVSFFTTHGDVFLFLLIDCCLIGLQHVTDLSGRETLVRITGMPFF